MADYMTEFRKLSFDERRALLSPTDPYELQQAAKLCGINMSDKCAVETYERFFLRGGFDSAAKRTAV